VESRGEERCGLVQPCVQHVAKCQHHPHEGAAATPPLSGFYIAGMGKLGRLWWYLNLVNNNQWNVGNRVDCNTAAAQETKQDTPIPPHQIWRSGGRCVVVVPIYRSAHCHRGRKCLIVHQKLKWPASNTNNDKMKNHHQQRKYKNCALPPTTVTLAL
jgi:hypothetical protein